MYDDLVLRRFLGKVNKTESCWLWTASADVKGYGTIRIKDKLLRAHRVSYELFKGPIPNGLHIMHSCDIPACVNPDHLSPGTALENAQDKMRKGRHRYVAADPEVRAEQMRRSWAAYTEDRKAARIKNMSIALLGKPFTPDHLANLRASPGNQKGRAVRYAPPRQLSDEQLTLIADRYAKGETAKSLAREFGASESVVIIWMRKKGITRLAGYGTGESGGFHANAQKKRTEAEKQAHSEKMKALWASGAFANRRPKST